MIVVGGRYGMDWPCLSITPNGEGGGDLNSNKLPGKMKFGIDESKSADFKNDKMEGVEFWNGVRLPPFPARQRAKIM